VLMSADTLRGLDSVNAETTMESDTGTRNISDAKEIVGSPLRAVRWA
jgi:hypothetical protein